MRKSRSAPASLFERTRIPGSKVVQISYQVMQAVLLHNEESVVNWFCCQTIFVADRWTKSLSRLSPNHSQIFAISQKISSTFAGIQSNPSFQKQDPLWITSNVYLPPHWLSKTLNKKIVIDWWFESRLCSAKANMATQSRDCCQVSPHPHFCPNVGSFEVCVLLSKWNRSESPRRMLGSKTLGFSIVAFLDGERERSAIPIKCSTNLPILNLFDFWLNFAQRTGCLTQHPVHVPMCACTH